MALSVVQKQDGCSPSEPPPKPQQTEEMCEGTLTGSINGTIRMEKCGCQCLQTRTFIVQIPPQSEGALADYLQRTVNNYENSGYLVLGHSLVDSGAGWMLGLSVGFYAP